MQTKTTYDFPKFYICKYGAFYEGEVLKHYCWSGGNNYSYVNDIVIDKFITHYYNYVPTLFFRFHVVGKSKISTLPCEGYLGILYRKYPKKSCK